MFGVGIQSKVSAVTEPSGYLEVKEMGVERALLAEGTAWAKALRLEIKTETDRTRKKASSEDD